MGLSCALPTSLSEVISTQLIKKKNDNNKAKGLKQRGPVITTTNNFPKDTVKPTDDVRTENLGDGQTFTQNPCSNTTNMDSQALPIDNSPSAGCFSYYQAAMQVADDSRQSKANYRN